MSTPKGSDADDITLRLAAANDDIARNRLVSDLHDELARIARAVIDDGSCYQLGGLGAG